MYSNEYTKCQRISCHLSHNFTVCTFVLLAQKQDTIKVNCTIDSNNFNFCQ